MIAVWFSCGAASAAALKLTLERFPRDTVRAINQPIIEEHEDNRRFLQDVSNWCGIEIETFTNPAYPHGSAAQVWEARDAMSFPHGAPCTVHLKKEARQAWEQINKPDWHVLGFTADERKRHDRFVTTERENVLPVLIDAGMTKTACGDMLRNAGIKLPEIYDLGFPNANCIGCVKATSPTYWNHVRRIFPEVFNERAAQSRKIGARLVRVKNERLFLDELDPTAAGAPMWTMPPCSLFCEEGAPSPARAINDSETVAMPRQTKWTKEALFEEASRFETRKEFREQSATAYGKLSANKWLDEACSHMTETRPRPAMPAGGSNAAGLLASLVDRVERLEGEKSGLAQDIKDVYAEGKAHGFDVRTLRALVKRRKQDPVVVAEQDAMLDLYMHALGMLPDEEAESDISSLMGDLT